MLYPMFALVVLTFIIFSINFYWRVNSVRNRTVHIRHYRLQQGGDVPPRIVAGGRQMSHLFETPVLFYVAGVLAITMGLEGALMAGLAWAYVAVRIIHAVIHMTYNNVIHRLIAFQVSFILLLVMWILLVIGR